MVERACDSGAGWPRQTRETAPQLFVPIDPLDIGPTKGALVAGDETA